MGISLWIFPMKNTQGTSLLEVLVSLFLISLFLLGLDAVQIKALDANIAAYYATVAEQQLINMRERMKVEKNLHQQIIIWNKENVDLLPHGKGCVIATCPVGIISIAWGEKSFAECRQDKIGKSGCLTIKVDC